MVLGSNTNPIYYTTFGFMMNPSKTSHKPRIRVSTHLNDKQKKGERQTLTLTFSNLNHARIQRKEKWFLYVTQPSMRSVDHGRQRCGLQSRALRRARGLRAPLRDRSIVAWTQRAALTLYHASLSHHKRRRKQRKEKVLKREGVVREGEEINEVFHSSSKKFRLVYMLQ